MTEVDNGSELLDRVTRFGDYSALAHCGQQQKNNGNWKVKYGRWKATGGDDFHEKAVGPHNGQDKAQPPGNRQ
eukprot:scaffold3095_cov163-Ochromonas_danica.AAC.2